MRNASDLLADLGINLRSAREQTDRRAIHQAEVDKHKGWPAIPMSSAYERMSELRAPIGKILPSSSPAVEAVAALWRRLKRASGK